MFSEQHEFDQTVVEQTMVEQAISKKYAWLALACAIGVHVLLFTIHIATDIPTLKTPNEIRITFLNEKVEEEKPVEEVEQQPNKQLKPLPPEQPSIVKPITSIIVAQPDETESEQSSTKVVVNTNSDEFNKFLNNETDSFRNANPKSLGEFSQTFEEPRREFNEVTMVGKEAEAQIRQMGVGMSQDKNGNRTCYTQTLDLLGNGSPKLLSKDCTPPKKFILDLDKPRNN